MSKPVVSLDEVTGELNLPQEEAETNKREWAVAWDMIEHYLGYDLNSNDVMDLGTCEYYLLNINYPGPIQNLRLATAEDPNTTITDYFLWKQTVFFSDFTYHRKRIFMEYKTGYDRKTLPDAILQTQMDLFMSEKYPKNPNQPAEERRNEILSKIAKYRRVHW